MDRVRKMSYFRMSGLRERHRRFRTAEPCATGTWCSRVAQYASSVTRSLRLSLRLYWRALFVHPQLLLLRLEYLSFFKDCARVMETEKLTFSSRPEALHDTFRDGTYTYVRP